MRSSFKDPLFAEPISVDLKKVSLRQAFERLLPASWELVLKSVPTVDVFDVQAQGHSRKEVIDALAKQVGVTATIDSTNRRVVLH